MGTHTYTFSAHTYTLGAHTFTLGAHVVAATMPNTLHRHTKHASKPQRGVFAAHSDGFYRLNCGIVCPTC